MNVIKRLFQERKVTLSSGKEVRRKRGFSFIIIPAILVFTVISGRTVSFSLQTLLERGGQFWVVLLRMFPPDTSYLASIWKPLLDTVRMSVAGTFLGSVLAIPFAFASSSNIVRNKPVVSIFRFFFSVLRTVPTLITALVATFIFGLGTAAGTFSIALFSFAYVGKLLYEHIEVADMSSYEAMLSLGCTKGRSFILSVIPQVLPLYLSDSLYCFEGNVRYASLLGYVGAGGIGLILNSQMGWRNYPRVGMILAVLFVTVVITSRISAALRRTLNGEGRKKKKRSLMKMSDEDVIKSCSLFDCRAVFLSLLSLLVIIWALSAVFTRSGTEVDTPRVLWSILSGIFHPDTNLLFNLTENGVPYLLLETAAIAFLGTIIGAFISLPFAFLSAGNIVPRPVAAFVRLLVMGIRTIPSFVYALAFMRVAGPGPFAGVMTMSVCSIGMLSRMISDEIENMDRGSLEALDAVGAGLFVKIRCAVIPSLAPQFISAVIYRFDVNLRESAVLGLVGAGGIGAPLIFAINGYKWNQAGAILSAYVLLVLAVEFLSSLSRASLTLGSRRLFGKK